MNSGRRGDMRVLVVIETPQTPNKRQEEIFRELAEIDQKDVAGPKKGFMERVKGWFKSSEPK